MANLEIVNVPNEILTTKAKPVEKIDRRVKKLIADMKETLLAQSDPEGVGIAAPQVGESLRIFMVVTEEPEDSGGEEDGERKITTFINPKITERSKDLNIDKVDEKEMIMEGCLSIPKLYGPVKRHHEVGIEFTDEEGNKREEKYKGDLSSFVQHEFDHINGILFTQRIVEQGGKLFRVEDGKWEEVDI